MLIAFMTFSAVCARVVFVVVETNTICVCCVMVDRQVSTMVRILILPSLSRTIYLALFSAAANVEQTSHRSNSQTTQVNQDLYPATVIQSRHSSTLANLKHQINTKSSLSFHNPARGIHSRRVQLTPFLVHATSRSSQILSCCLKAETVSLHSSKSCSLFRWLEVGELRAWL